MHSTHHNKTNEIETVWSFTNGPISDSMGRNVASKFISFRAVYVFIDSINGQRFQQRATHFRIFRYLSKIVDWVSKVSHSTKAKPTIVMVISPGTHPLSSPYSSTNILPRYRKQEWGLVPYTLTICEIQHKTLIHNCCTLGSTELQLYVGMTWFVLKRTLGIKMPFAFCHHHQVI